MVCPPDIAVILLKILEESVLRIRVYGWSGNGARCAVEADHVHNLPSLLADFSPPRLQYYWEVERQAYISQCPDTDFRQFEDLWRQLAPHVGRGREQLTAR